MPATGRPRMEATAATTDSREVILRSDFRSAAWLLKQLSSFESSPSSLESLSLLKGVCWRKSEEVMELECCPDLGRVFCVSVILTVFVGSDSVDGPVSPATVDLLFLSDGKRLPWSQM